MYILLFALTGFSFPKVVVTTYSGHFVLSPGIGISLFHFIRQYDVIFLWYGTVSSTNSMGATLNWAWKRPLGLMRPMRLTPLIILSSSKKNHQCFCAKFRRGILPFNLTSSSSRRMYVVAPILDVIILRVVWSAYQSNVDYVHHIMQFISFRMQTQRSWPQKC